MSWTEHLHLTRLLGSGGQGVVYLSERRGTDNFTLPVALKIFSPARYEDARSYDEAMGRIAQIAARVAQIQQDNLLDVHNFVERNRIRMMEMEWIDGYDLSRLLTHEMLDRTRERVSNRRWEYLNNVIVTAGPMQPRLKPGIAIAIAARVPGGAGGPASRGDRARRHQAVEHHAQADRQRQDRRHRLGLRADRRADPPHLHADLRRARSARRRRLLAALATWPAWATC